METGRQKGGKKPLYLSINAKERAARIGQLSKIMAACTFCPRKCRVNRRLGERGKCGAASDLLISSAGPHFGEERELVGSGGSGTIFFINCNLECVFCQNWTISRAYDQGMNITTGQLARLMLDLQRRGCSNINLVTPTPYLYHIVSAIDEAIYLGLTLPIVYNCGGYESEESLKLLEGFIDIYMPDAKYGSDKAGEKYSGVSDYYTRLRGALLEMQRQVGDLKIDESGLAYRGLLVRHLVMPDRIAGSAEIARMLNEDISPNCAVNIMNQYHPAYQADHFPQLNRRITASEYEEARQFFTARQLKVL